MEKLRHRKREMEKRVATLERLLKIEVEEYEKISDEIRRREEEERIKKEEDNVVFIILDRFDQIKGVVERYIIDDYVALKFVDTQHNCIIFNNYSRLVDFAEKNGLYVHIA